METATTAVAERPSIHPDAIARQQMLQEHLTRNSSTPPHDDEEKEPELLTHNS